LVPVDKKDEDARESMSSMIYAWQKVHVRERARLGSLSLSLDNVSHKIDRGEKSKSNRVENASGTARSDRLDDKICHSSAQKRHSSTFHGAVCTFNDIYISYLFVSSPRFCDVALRALRLENLRACVLLHCLEEREREEKRRQ